MVNVLFVCTGNICRSPTAEGVFRALVERQGLAREIGIDSAGLTSHHVGEPPDHRADAAAINRGIDLSRQRARLIEPLDFEDFAYIIGMDKAHGKELLRMCPKEEHKRIHLFLGFAPQTGHTEIPDPFYGGASDFEEALDLIEAAADGLITHIIRQDL